MPCASLPQSGTFASSFIAYADCQARTIGSQGYFALAAPGSSISLLISTLLTITIAFVGYRLLLGASFTLREGVLTLVKIGLVIAFATGWPAYRTVIYDTAILAPSELGATIGGAAGLPGAAGDLAVHLDAVDQQFQTLSIDNVNRPFVPPAPGTVPPPLFAGFDVFALGAARVIFLVGAVGSWCATRLVAGFLLAIGPLFIAFLLFDATRGLVEGWIKVLFGAVLGTLATSIVLGAELALLEPWLSNLISVRGADAAIPGAAAQLLAATTIFAVALAAGIAAAARLTYSLRIPSMLRGDTTQLLSSKAAPFATILPTPPEALASQITPRTRAQSIADTVTMLDRRDAMAVSSGALLSNGSAPRFTAGGLRTTSAYDAASNALASAGARRRTSARVSASAQRRDKTL